MNIPRPHHSDRYNKAGAQDFGFGRQAPSLLMAFTLTRLRAEQGLQVAGPDEKPKKPEPEIEEPGGDRVNPVAPPEMPSEPNIPGSDMPGRLPEVGPSPAVESPAMPDMPEVGPLRDMHGVLANWFQMVA